MFGYVLPEKPHLCFKDFDLYTGFYCGVCKSMGRQFSQKCRLFINYDITFLAALVHNYLDEDVKLVPLKCVYKGHKGNRLMVSANGLTDKLAALNVLLSYYKLKDDVADESKISKKLAAKLYKNDYKRAKQIFLRGDEIISENYSKLFELEKSRIDSIDRVSDCFANMMKELVVALCDGKTDDNFEKMCYNVGKWIYLIDALDDYGEDVKEGKYNPFEICYGKYSSLKEMIEKKGGEIDFLFGTLLNRIKEDCEKVKFNFNTDLIKNVLYRGLPLKTMSVIKGEKCKRTPIKF